MNTIAPPATTEINDRKDGIIIWRYTLANGSTVDVDAPDQPTADALFAVWQTPAKKLADPMPAAIAAAVVAAAAITDPTADPAALTNAAEQAAAAILSPSPVK